MISDNVISLEIVQRRRGTSFSSRQESMMAEAEAKVQNVKDPSFGRDKCTKNRGTDEAETGEIERWDSAPCIERQSEKHPAFADCVEVR